MTEQSTTVLGRETNTMEWHELSGRAAFDALGLMDMRQDIERAFFAEMLGMPCEDCIETFFARQEHETIEIVRFGA